MYFGIICELVSDTLLKNVVHTADEEGPESDDEEEEEDNDVSPPLDLLFF